MAYQLDVSGRDVPKSKEEWEALTTPELAVFLCRDGMLKHSDQLRADYLRIHVAQTRCNIAEAQVENRPAQHNQTVNILNNAGSLGLEEQRSAIVSACRAELQRRGIDIDSTLATVTGTVVDSSPASG